MKKHRRKRLRRAIFWLIVCVIAVSIYRSANSPEVTQYDIRNSKIPNSFDGFKIVQLSDFHGAKFGDEICGKVEEQNPDIIVITGDFITTGEDLPRVEELVSKLVRITDVYFVSGNHDYGSGEIDALTGILDRHGVRFLRNEFDTLENGGERIVLAGVEDPNSWAEMMHPDELAAAIRQAYPDAYTVLLGHRNYWADEYPELPVDLIFCGHGHGGIVRIPGVGGVLGSDRHFFPEYDAGLFECGSYDMIVSRGLGNSVKIPRLFNRPELVCVTLHTS